MVTHRILGKDKSEAFSDFRGPEATPDVAEASYPVWSVSDQVEDIRAYNGSEPVDLIAPIAASGNQAIDGLLRGNKWADGFISYSDPDSATDYQVGHPEQDNMATGFGQMTAQQMVAMHFALSDSVLTQPLGAAGFSVEGFTGLSIAYAGTGLGTGTIRAANLPNISGTAYAYYPSNMVWGGDAFMLNSGDYPDAGDYDWHTVLHELGHSLGLKHGHETSGFGAVPTSLDGLEWTIMSYRDYAGDAIDGYEYGSWDAPQTYMRGDIAALQHMYGADYTVNSGNTTYKWSPLNGDTYVNGALAINAGGDTQFLTVWDGGGIDTYDFSAYTTDLVSINLTPGSYSLTNTSQQAFLGDGHFAAGTIYNAMLFQGNTASQIENAIGGSGKDSIIGGDANNTLTGGAGNDTLNGGGGNDTLLGGTDNDILSGGGGNDFIWGSDGADNITGGDGSDQIHGGGGNDALRGNGGADRFYFDTALGAGNTDTISGYVLADSIYLAMNVFGAIGTTLAPSEFCTGAGALDANDFVIYNAAGSLFYDFDGNGANAQIQFATLAGAPVISCTEFVLF